MTVNVNCLLQNRLAGREAISRGHQGDLYCSSFFGLLVFSVWCRSHYFNTYAAKHRRGRVACNWMGRREAAMMLDFRHKNEADTSNTHTNTHTHSFQPSSCHLCSCQSGA